MYITFAVDVIAQNLSYRVIHTKKPSIDFGRGWYNIAKGHFFLIDL